MSVNIHLSLYVEKLSSPAEADAIEVAVEQVSKEHGIDSWVQVSVFHNPPRGEGFQRERPDHRPRVRRVEQDLRTRRHGCHSRDCAGGGHRSGMGISGRGLNCPGPYLASP